MESASDIEELKLKIKNIKIENNDFEKDLLKLLKSGNSLLFIGAGASVIAGLPSWLNLLNELKGSSISYIINNQNKIDPQYQNRTNQNKDEYNQFLQNKLQIQYDEDYLMYAERLRSILSMDEYDDFLTRIFKKKHTCSKLHNNIIKLPCKTILSTNYDNLLDLSLHNAQKAYECKIILDESTNKHNILEFLHSLNTEQNKKMICYLHGYYERVNTILLTQKDYERRYGVIDLENINNGWTLLRRITWAMMTFFRIIYIGFSMNDPYFAFIHKILSKEFCLSGSNTHFLLKEFDKTNVDELERKSKDLNTKFGIRTIFFEKIENELDFGLTKYLDKLISEIEKENTSDIKQIVNKEAISALNNIFKHMEKKS